MGGQEKTLTKIWRGEAINSRCASTLGGAESLLRLELHQYTAISCLRPSINLHYRSKYAINILESYHKKRLNEVDGSYTWNP